MAITRTLAFLALSAAALSGIAFAQRADPKAPPPANASKIPVEVEPPMVDFGVVGPGTKHPAKFTLRNVGNAPLTVSRAQPSCKCTDISPIVGKTIKPGETLEVSAALSVPRSPGEKDAKVMISFAGMQGLVLAQMKADVTLPVRVAPAYLDALAGKTGGTITLSSVDGKPFKILSAGGKAPQVLSAEGAETPGQPAARQVLRWDITSVPPAALQEWWIVETDRADCPIIPIRLRHALTGVKFDAGKAERFWFVPESVVVAGRLKAGQTAELTTSIEFLPPRASDVAVSPEWGKVTAMNVPGGEGTVELMSATARGTDFVDVVFKFTPAATLKGAAYVPVNITTPTGTGKVYVAVAVDG